MILCKNNSNKSSHSQLERFFFAGKILEIGRKDKFYAAGNRAGNKKNYVVIHEVCLIRLITAKIKLITEFLSECKAETLKGWRCICACVLFRQ